MKRARKPTFAVSPVGLLHIDTVCSIAVIITKEVKREIAEIAPLIKSQKVR